MECSLKYKKLRHSGVGRNPACHITSRSGQNRVLGVVPLVELLAIRLMKLLAIRLMKLLAIPLMKLLAIPLMKLLAIPLGCQRTTTKWLVIGCQKALHSHSAKSPKYGDISRWLTSAKSLVMRGDIVNCLDSGTLTSILSRLRERRRSLFPPLGESWIEGRPE